MTVGTLPGALAPTPVEPSQALLPSLDQWAISQGERVGGRGEGRRIRTKACRPLPETPGFDLPLSLDWEWRW